MKTEPKKIELQQIGKKYKIYHERQMITKDFLFGWVKPKKEEEIWVLKGVSLQINKGETIGIIGENGSGKTTLLRILSGVTRPTRGTASVRGEVLSLLELGSGFHPDLSGRENIYLNGSLLGLRKKEISDKFSQIVEFSGLDEFIDTPLRNYSSGMYLRLGFAVAACVARDILLIDEVLSVGDEAFQRKCLEKIREFRAAGMTIVFSSHDLDMILNLCDRVFLLSRGRIIKSGRPADVVQFYIDTVGKKEIAILQKGPLDVIFNRGAVSLYWQGKKLTKGPGGFVSVVSSGKWFGSNQAEWKIKFKDDTSFIAQARWPKLPITQTWELGILDGNSLSWKLDTSIEGDGFEGQEQINLMLSDEYRKWFIDKQAETFAQIQVNDSAWQEFFSRQPVFNAVGISPASKEEGMPSICFEPQDKEKKDIVKLFNSEYTSNARVLQYSDIMPQNKGHSLTVRIIFDLADIGRYIETKFEEKMGQIILNERNSLRQKVPTR